ncbi:MAG: HutD family protein [Alphaproteobacteria bacterium]|nr:HutD family protein [Alphaproteobacteria bacterium]MCW5739140.1 HutD family protein [Alphaproteobacteria bacterium]
MERVRVAALPRTPWRNGGGTTTALAAEPEGASFDDCLWRVDVSDIGRAGPFSHLAGLDRTLVPLASGLVLTIDGRRHELAPFEPFAFSGDSTTTCDTAAPLQALNALARRGKAATSVGRWPGAGRIRGPGTLVFHVVRGGFSVVEGGDRPTQVDAGSAALVRALGQPVAFEPTAAWSLALSVLIRLA